MIIPVLQKAFMSQVTSNNRSCYLKQHVPFFTGSLKSHYFTLLIIRLLFRPSWWYFSWTHSVEGALKRSSSLALHFPAGCSYASQAVDCVCLLGGEFVVVFTFWLFLTESIKSIVTNNSTLLRLNILVVFAGGCETVLQ